MIIALCQINPIVGDFRYNSRKIVSFYHQAMSLGAHLAVFPELVIPGYPPQDLLLRSEFIARNLETAEEVASQMKGIPAIFGFVRTGNSEVFNCAAVVTHGKIAATYDKILLPTYDVFDEDRYFTPGTEANPVHMVIDGVSVPVGLQICEDLWDDGYDCKVTDEMVHGGAELILNISASPFHEGKRFERMRLIEDKVRHLKKPFLYCNLVGAQDELIFDGHSLAYDGEGNLTAEGKQFEEEVIAVEVDGKSSTIVKPRPYNRAEELFHAIALGIRDYFVKTGHEKCVIGLSGGIDSALTVCLATEALGKENVTCLSMPSRYSSKHSLDDSAALVNNLAVKLITIPIGDLMKTYDEALGDHFEGFKRDITEENIQARIRGNLLMAFSNKFGYLVLSTGNKTELALGYCTLYGDMSGGLAVISDLSKADVYEVARWYNGWKRREVIPQSIFDKRPSAELSEGQVDPFDYDVVSPLVDKIIEEHRSRSELVEMGHSPELVDRILVLIKRAEFKRRQAAPGLRVTSKAFGIGRRFPVVNHFSGDLK